MPLRVLVTGGSGYLGQFIIAALSKQSELYDVLYTYSTRKLLNNAITGHQVDFLTGDGLEDLFASGPPFAAVINCAAISQPGICEQSPETARAINVPTKLVASMLKQKQESGIESLLIHISTDQVYEGTKAMWAEEDACNPVNAYGCSKLEAEIFIKDSWPRHVILRSSIIYGPPPPEPVPRMLFLQFIEKSLSEGSPTSFFIDEYRCPVYVGDIIKIMQDFLKNLPSIPTFSLYNMGGADRLSRLDMAEKVADVRGYDRSSIVSVPSSSVQRSVASPADISMNMERLKRDTGIVLTSFSASLKHFPPCC